MDERAPVRQGYRKARRDAFGQGTARLQQASGAAVSSILKIMVDTHTPASTKLRAADMVLSHGAKAMTAANLARARSPLLLARIASGGCWRDDTTGRRRVWLMPPGHWRSKLPAARPIRRLAAAGRWVPPVKSGRRPPHSAVGLENRKPQALAERETPAAPAHALTAPAY